MYLQTTNYKLQTNRGFSLVEALLAISLLSLLVTAFVGAILYGQGATATTGARGRATLLAEEGLEAVRNIRDASFASLVDGTYGLATASGVWTFSGASDTTGGFTRQITVASVNVNAKRITSTVTWSQSLQRTGSVVLDSYLENWMTVGAVLPGKRIAYYHSGSGDLKYASCDANCTIAGNWTKVTVDASGDVGQFASLSVDSGKPRIAYYDNSNKDLKYAACDSSCTTASNWTKISIDTAGDVGSYASLALDSEKPRIAYYDGGGNKDLKYASCDSSCTTAANWTAVTVDSSGDVGNYASLALDGVKPRIAYYEAGGPKDLKYASCDASCTTVANWTKISVDTSGDVGNYASLALDGANPRIAHYDSVNNRDVRYSSCDSNCTTASNWTSVSFDTSGDVGSYASLRLDSGKPRVSYSDSTNNDLKYATCDTSCTTASNWTKVSVDTTGSVGQYTSIALDSSKSRVSYFDSTNNDLKYATCDTACTTVANWSTGSIDTTGNVGLYTSMNK